jgi:hypothetical protein
MTAGEGPFVSEAPVLAFPSDAGEEVIAGPDAENQKAAHSGGRLRSLIRARENPVNETGPNAPAPQSGLICKPALRGR